jgi:sulfoxide reductase heme-binding subunit YedZ
LAIGFQLSARSRLIDLLKKNWHFLLAHVAGIGPLAVLVYYYASDTVVNPIRFIIVQTGAISLIFLVASLACTPVRKILGWSGAVQIRRALGLYGFLYAALHFWAYLDLENDLYFDLIWRDLGERRAMPVGIIAFLLLVPLAVTSTRGWQRRLGKRWRQLHRLVYIAIPVCIWHYFWLDRDFVTWPLIYGAIVAVLLLVRLPFFRPLINSGIRYGKARQK